MKARAHRRTQAGMTLLEVAAAVTLFVGVVGVAVTVTRTGSEEFRSTSLHADLDMKAHRVLDRIARELSLANAASLAAVPSSPVWAESVTFQQPAGRPAADGTFAWRTVRIALEPDAGETFDGADEDGDGLVDEGVVALVQDPGGPDEQRVVLCRWVRGRLEGELVSGADENGNGLVDERGLCFERLGDRITVRLSLERRTSGGEPFVKTVATSVTVRN